MPSSQAPPAGSTALDPTAVRPPIDDARIERVDPSTVRARLEALKGEGFQLLLDLGAVDYLEREPRFDVVYHLLKLSAVPSSQLIEAPERVRILCGVSLDEHVPSVADLWASADWAEREVFDLFGIVFDGHPDLRRIQMPVEWAGYPLRKDYPVRGPALERTPRPSFANKSNVAAGTPPSGRVAVALQRQIAIARGQAPVNGGAGGDTRPHPARGAAEPEAAKGGASPSQHTAGEAKTDELAERPINLKSKSNEQ